MAHSKAHGQGGAKPAPRTAHGYMFLCKKSHKDIKGAAARTGLTLYHAAPVMTLNSLPYYYYCKITFEFFIFVPSPMSTPVLGFESTPKQNDHNCFLWLAQIRNIRTSDTCLLKAEKSVHPIHG